MCGWQAPEKHEFEHGYKAQQELIEVIARLRGRSGTQQSVRRIGLARSRTLILPKLAKSSTGHTPPSSLI
jgi:hypothetical protein